MLFSHNAENMFRITKKEENTYDLMREFLYHSFTYTHAHEYVTRQIFYLCYFGCSCYLNYNMVFHGKPCLWLNISYVLRLKLLRFSFGLAEI